MAGMVKGRVLIVTGAGSGIGKAAALLFAEEGAHVVVADVAADTAGATAWQIGQAGGSAVPAIVDIADEAQVTAMVRLAVDRFGRLDGAFNNAGIGHLPQPVTALARAEWERVLTINLTGTFLCLKHEIPALVAAGGGAIVNMSSVGGATGVPMMAAYAASKHGINGLTRSAAVETARQNVRINALCAGVVDTPPITASGIDWNRISPTAMGRIADPREIAQAALWLLSDKSSYITGQAIQIDGGMTAAATIQGAG